MHIHVIDLFFHSGCNRSKTEILFECDRAMSLWICLEPSQICDGVNDCNITNNDENEQLCQAISKISTVHPRLSGPPLSGPSITQTCEIMIIFIVN